MATHRIIVLKAVYKEMIKKNPSLAGKIAEVSGMKSLRTVERWLLKPYSLDLTTASCLAIIREFCGVSESEVLTEEIEVDVEQGAKSTHAFAHTQAHAC